MSTPSRDSHELDHLDEALIRERLRVARFARLGYVDGEQPVVVPVNIATDDGHVLMRTAAGTALASLDGQRVAIEIDHHDARTRAGWSILVQGVMRDVTAAADAEARRWQRATVDTWAPGVRDRLLVVLPLSITGRLIRAEIDSDWFAGVPAS